MKEKHTENISEHKSDAGFTDKQGSKKKLVIIGTRQLFKEGLIKEMKRRNTGLKELLEHEK